MRAAGLVVHAALLEHVSDFGLFPFRQRVHAHPSAGNANRWLALCKIKLSGEKYEKQNVTVLVYHLVFGNISNCL